MASQDNFPALVNSFRAASMTLRGQQLFLFLRIFAKHNFRVVQISCPERMIS